ncbi:MAG: HAMP domain-containing histidine kinase [Bacteroidaceae bacterium]|nr:HAMP domain-containing histidine kinase [Bacteroidaceae bacterium]
MRKIKEFKRIRTVLIVVAIIIAVSSLFVSQSLVKDLSREEHSKMELFAQAYQSLSDADENTDLGLVLAVLSGNKTIPVIVVDENNEVKSYLNIEIRKADTLTYLNGYVERMRSLGNSIKIYFDESDTEHYNEVCFDESLLLNRLTVYPYIQMGVVLLFVLIAIFALLSFKKTEQNRVWVGLSKETAHQLGTPISSLMAWTELLKDKYDDDLITEMEKDVNRLQMVAERFSKIGSMPEPVTADMVGVLDGVIDYVEHRSPATVKFVRDFPNPPVNARVNASLFGWVIENICKNAVDAMSGKGRLTIKLTEDKNHVTIDVTDTGKGIAKNSWRSIFDPGYTTKERGWGLGLSLAKRIVTEYHKGKIYVAHSELNKGTTFRIEIPK